MNSYKIMINLKKINNQRKKWFEFLINHQQFMV